MQKLSKWNKGYKYLLMALDIFSKYGWLVPLKTKTGLEVSQALASIFRENKPKMLWVDKGKEHYNRHVLNLLAKNKTEIYSTENEEKSSVCERWNRTIKTKMYTYIHTLLQLPKRVFQLQESNSLYKTTRFTLTSYLKYSLLTTIANIDQ